MKIGTQMGGQDNTPEENEGGRGHINYMDTLCSILKGVERKEGDTSKSLTGIYGVSPSDVLLGEIFSLITTDSHVKRMTDKCRRLTGMGKSDEAGACKRMEQHCFFPSARMEGGTKDDDCAEFTNIVMADYDHLDPAEVERCRELLRTDQHCLMMYKTIRGHGFHILVPVMGVCSKETHKIAWEQVNAYYDNLLGLKHDASCANIARKSILANDPLALCNPAPVPMYIDYAALVKDRKPGRPLKDVHHSLEEVGKHVNDYLKARGLKYEEGNRNNYIFNAACQLNRYGVGMDEVLDFFGREAADLATEEIHDAVASAYRRYADQHGTQSPFKRGDKEREKADKKGIDIQSVENYIATLGDFRHNLITQRYEVCFQDETEWTEISDNTFNDIWRKVCKNIRHLPDKIIRNIIESSFSPSCNPLIESLERLTPWDGVTDHIGTLAAMVHVKPEYNAYFPFKDALKKWLVGVAASICTPKGYNKKVLTFVGKQNTYKTTFVRSLALPEWGTRATHFKNNFNDFNRDERLSLTQTPIFCLDEISNMGTRFLDELKSLTSQTSINERRFFAHHTEARQRISSFCATGNRTDFLTDDTGNSRFLVFEVDSIDNPYGIPEELIKGVWAQAYSLLQQGYQYWFTPEEDALIERQNNRYVLNSTEEELIQTYYLKPEPGEQYLLQSASDIMVHLGIFYKGPLKKYKITQALRNLGFEEKHSSRKRGFMVKEIPQADITMRQQSSDWSHLPPLEDTAQTNEQATLF